MRGATRRRGSELERAILDAAWEQLAEGGWEGFTVAAVAARCGTAKAVLYRRWRDRVALAQEVLARALADEEREPVSSGDLRTDLHGFLRGLHDFYAGPFGQAVRGVLAEREDRTSSLVGPAVPRAVAALVEAAVERGELAGRPGAMAQNLGHALVTAELVHTAAPLGGAHLEELLDDVWLPALRRSAEAAAPAG